MSDHLPRTNRWLIALSVILCLILGGIFTRSSAVTSQADAISDTGAFVSEDQDSAEFTSEETLTDSNDNFTDSSSGKLFGRTSSDSSETSPGGPVLSTDISPEASEGSWASSGSNWMFLVDDKPYTGWFTDTDGKQYYMDETGIMQTGWTDIGKKRYYFDMDGILQTGTVIIDKKTYELDQAQQSDPSLEEFLNGLGEEAGVSTEAEDGTMLTASEECNVRAEASTDADILGVISAGDQVQKTGTDGEWVQIDYDGQTGYIRGDLLE